MAVTHRRDFEMQYWIDTGKTTHGPFDATQLKTLASNGELKRDNKISTDQERWVIAESIKGLAFKTVLPQVPELSDLFDEEFGDEKIQSNSQSPQRSGSQSGMLDAASANSSQRSLTGNSSLENAATQPHVRDRERELQALQEELWDYKQAGAAMGIHAFKSSIDDHVIGHVASAAFGKHIELTSDTTVEAFDTTRSILKRKWALETISDPNATLPVWTARFGGLLLTSVAAVCVTVISVVISLLTPLVGLVTCILGLGVVLIGWHDQLRPIGRAVADYPHVVNSPKGVFLKTPYYQFVCGLLWLFGVGAIANMVTRVEIALPNTTPKTVALPDGWSRYADPKGRFTCDVPPGWSIDESKWGKQSKVTIRLEGHEIRVTVRDTNVHEMYDGIREEMTEGMADLARHMGSDGTVGNVEWTTLAGSRALQIDIESKLRERFARTIKAKHEGWDHFLGMYVEPSSQREELCDLFEEFLNRYGSTN
jgi:hypothetical protein